MSDVLTQFRAKKRLKIADPSARLKPLSSGNKAADKLRTDELAAEIAMLQEILYAQRQHKVLIVLQGMDTSGKDGTVRGVFGKVDPLGIITVSFKAPTERELAHDYLWRVHQQIPGKGEIVIFNRSHYEDVLVTRVHDLIDDRECTRRYAHIRDFERMLAETGTILMKFFLHISKDEQKGRLQDRIDEPTKHWKFDPQDIKERAFWDQYQKLYQHAIVETDADHAPWYVIPSDSKSHRNLAIASIVRETLQSLKPSYPPANPAFAGMRID